MEWFFATVCTIFFRFVLIAAHPFAASSSTLSPVHDNSTNLKFTLPATCAIPRALTGNRLQSRSGGASKNSSIRSSGGHALESRPRICEELKRFKFNETKHTDGRHWYFDIRKPLFTPREPRPIAHRVFDSPYWLVFTTNRLPRMVQLWQDDPASRSRRNIFYCPVNAHESRAGFHAWMYDSHKHEWRFFFVFRTPIERETVQLWISWEGGPQAWHAADVQLEVDGSVFSLAQPG